MGWDWEAQVVPEYTSPTCHVLLMLKKLHSEYQEKDKQGFQGMQKEARSSFLSPKSPFQAVAPVACRGIGG